MRETHLLVNVALPKSINESPISRDTLPASEFSTFCHDSGFRVRHYTHASVTWRNSCCDLCIPGVLIKVSQFGHVFLCGLYEVSGINLF